MDTRRTRRKRRNSSASNFESCPPVLSSKTRTRQSDGAASMVSCETPRHPLKRVRFSDPGPDYSTGLTPAMRRTSFEETGDGDALQRTPSRRSRRHSTPIPRSRRFADSPLPLDSASSERVLHFTPLRQILDSRTQRRIRRLGLSDEINNFEREKRASAQYEKALQSLRHERDSLRQELELANKYRTPPENQSPPGDGEWTVALDRDEHPDSDDEQLRTELSLSVSEYSHNQPTLPDSEVQTIMVDDSAFEGDTLLVSDSPDIRGMDIRLSPVPGDFSLLSRKSIGIDASVQTSQHSRDLDAELLALSRDLEAAKKEKRDLFETCRSRLGQLDGTALGPHLRQPSPPPNFINDIIPTLMQALERASNATQTLQSLQDELAGLGFQGTNANEIISEMRDRFRAARLELERAVPGETPNAGLGDGASTLSALVKRVEVLVKDLHDEQTRHQGSVDREKALRGQFDTLLARYETASKKIEDLEDSIASSAGDMLHTRMQMQELEREAQEHVVSVERLNAALSKYHDDIKGLEAVVTRLEDEKTQRIERHQRQISELEQRIAEGENARHAAESTIAERDRQIQELEGVIEQNRIRVCDLTAKVEMIERERCKAVESLQQSTAEQALKHEQEIGLMNVRVSELNTALEAAMAETEKLHRSNSGLEEQLRLEIESRDNLLDRWAAEQARSFAFMKATVNAERRKSKIRAANWELKSDEIQSDSTAIGSEPITPVSMTRFVDVEVGRGKDRRRLDSGIGILTEDELEDDADAVQQLLPSDPADL